MCNKFNILLQWQYCKKNSLLNNEHYNAFDNEMNYKKIFPIDENKNAQTKYRYYYVKGYPCHVSRVIKKEN